MLIFYLGIDSVRIVWKIAVWENVPDCLKEACKYIMKTCLFKYIENFTTKNENFQMKSSGSFHISAQNIDCGYLLELHRRGGSNEYPQSMFFLAEIRNVYPCKPQFYCIKVGFKACFRDA